MARFSPASPQQARLKFSLYGKPGSGKTFTALLMAEGLAKLRGKRIAYVDTERGTDFYAQAVQARKIHPERFDFDAIYTRSLAEITEAINALEPTVHGVVVLDSISHLWESAIDAYTGKRTSRDTIPMHAWGAIKKPYKALIAKLIASPFDVFILGRQKNVFEEGADGELRAAGVAMKAEGETQYEPHICARMESDPTAGCVWAYFEKDRTGILANRRVANPSFATIEPLLPLLGDVQAQAEDDDERAAKDAELLEAEETKRAEKGAKSKGLFDTFLARLQAAGAMEEIGAISVEIKKASRSLTAEHLEALRQVRASRIKSISAQAAGVL